MQKSLLTSLLAVVSVLSVSLIIVYLLRFRIIELPYRLIALGTLAIIFFYPVYWLLNSVILPCLTPYPMKILITWSALCLVIGFLLMVVIAKNLPEFHTLEIIATGQKNTSAKGSEVWVLGRRHDFGDNLDTPDFISDGLWEKRNRDLIAYKKQPARLQWHGQLKYDGALYFLQHPWSGIVEVLLDGNSPKVDLYSEKRGYHKIAVPTKIYTLTRIVFEGALSVSLSFAYFFISVFIITLPPKKHS